MELLVPIFIIVSNSKIPRPGSAETGEGIIAREKSEAQLRPETVNLPKRFLSHDQAEEVMLANAE